MTAWMIVLAAIISNASAGVFMKLLTKTTPLQLSKDGLLAVMQNPYAYLAVAGYGAALVLFTLALSKLDLSIAYTTIVSGAIVLVTILSLLLFNEPMTLNKGLGMALILLGVFMLYRI